MNWTFYDFLKNRDLSNYFFNSLLNLNKFINIEQRDPFQYKNEMNDTVGYNEWDRFARIE